MAGSSQAQKLHDRQDIFLSHSGQDKAFVEQLYHDLKRVNHHPFFDQSSYSLPKAEKFAPAIFEAAEQCRLGVVVVSEGYLTSKWPMLELSKFVESKKTSNPELRLLPLYFRLSPGDLKQEEVDTKWTPSWRQLVERGEVKEEVVELWSEAVKELRRHNGLEYGKFVNSEYKYRSAVVAKICKRLPPILRWNTDHIQGYERLCKMASSMFNAEVVDGDNKVCKYLGLYGMGGVGKTTLCKALCSYFQGEFRGRVCHVELTSDQGNERLASAERLACLKRVVQQLAAFEKSVPQGISSEEQGWECLKNGLRNQAPIFLAIDNVGDSESSREEAQSYLNAGLPSGSKVLVTSRSQEILENVLGRAEYCKPIPRLEHDEAAKLFLSKAAPKKSSFNDEESEIVERCLKECQFTDNGYTSTQYHPLILRALGTYFHDVHSVDVLSWEEALENKNKLQRSREAKHVNDILGLNYRSLSDQEKLVFLDTALYPYHGYAPLPWWSKGKRSDYDLWVSWIYEAHGVSPLDARMMVEKLQRLSLLEVSSLEEPYAHDLYKEFARVLVEQEGSKEWEWWMSREELGSGNVPQLKRLVLEKDKSLIGRPPRKFQEWRSLVFLELIQCDNIGPVLELGGLNNLTVLALYKCANLKRILSSCSNGCNDQIFCYKGKPGQGCMSELRSVKLQRLSVLEDIPFLRHCSNLETLRILDCNRAIYPTTSVDSESRAAIDLEYLKALRTLSVSEGWNFNILGYDIGAFITWLLAAVRLQMLTAFEYQSHEPVWVEEAMVEVDERLGGYTIDLNEVGHLSSELSVLSLRLPWQIVEMKGLHLLSKLTTLNLNWCRGLRQLPDLRGLPKLKRMCVHGCCRLEAPPCLGAGVQEIGDFFPTGYLSLSHDYPAKVWTSHECLRPYCKETNCHICRKRTEDESEGSSVCFRPNLGSEHSEHGPMINRWLGHPERLAMKRSNVLVVRLPGEFRNLNNGPSSYDKMKMVEVTLLAKEIAQQYQRQGASSKSNSPTPCISLPRPGCVAPATMNREKLMKMASAVRIGGKGSVRRKNKSVHKTTAADDKRLQNTLKRLGVNTIPGIEEVNIFKDETVIHFVNPKVQASLAANTCVVSGPSQTKKLEELLPSIINQLGPDNLVALRKIDQQYQSQAAAGTTMFLTL